MSTSLRNGVKGLERLACSKYYYVGKHSIQGSTLPKIPIASKKASNKSCSELNLVQKSLRAHMSVSCPLEWSQGARKIGRFEVLLCKETANYIQFRAQRCQKYASHQKKLQIKVAQAKQVLSLHIHCATAAPDQQTIAPIH